ncbi:YrhK family protein [Salinicola aestuarinus]|uniref:YrhK family protein n=1 Tax=Salinicola aestuarinus TaxID=1949082 RepID=UPI000DA11ACF|nr:YrhK family protein [Salinicola aestuarinus]
MNEDNRNQQPRTKTLHFGHDELVIRQRYETLSIVNDVLIGIWFVVGSFLFFFESLTYYGTWLFLIGSLEMLIRPVIRLTRRLHLTRRRGGSGSAVETSHDF